MTIMRYFVGDVWRQRKVLDGQEGSIPDSGQVYGRITTISRLSPGIPLVRYQGECTSYYDPPMLPRSRDRSGRKSSPPPNTGSRERPDSRDVADQSISLAQRRLIFTDGPLVGSLIILLLIPVPLNASRVHNPKSSPQTPIRTP